MIKAELDYAPTTNGKKFDKWCEKYGFTPLGSGRRAWCPSLSTYFRSALGLATTQGGESFLFYEEDLADAPDPVDTDQPSSEHEAPTIASTPEAPIHPELDEILKIYAIAINSVEAKGWTGVTPEHTAKAALQAWSDHRSNEARESERQLVEAEAYRSAYDKLRDELGRLSHPHIQVVRHLDKILIQEMILDIEYGGDFHRVHIATLTPPNTKEPK